LLCESGSGAAVFADAPNAEAIRGEADLIATSSSSFHRNHAHLGSFDGFQLRATTVSIVGSAFARSRLRLVYSIEGAWFENLLTML
jgi:hypothetical protein